MVAIENLVKRYDDFSLNVSLEIPDGTITGIIGKNGAGKSTTIKSILGLITPDEGSVKVFGKDADKLDKMDKQRLGVALSDSGFSGFLTVEDVIHILRKLYMDFDEKGFREICKSQNLPLKKFIKEFSTGMKAKLRVLVAISHKADLLIMDEPTSGLDVEARIDILDMLRTYMAEDEKRSILITSHISSDLEGLCDDIYLIHNGGVLIHEETDRILGSYALLKMDDKAYEKLDKSHVLRVKKENFGYMCLTDERQYYSENYPEITVENGSVDDLILMMTGGDAVC